MSEASQATEADEEVEPFIVAMACGHGSWVERKRRPAIQWCGQCLEYVGLMVIAGPTEAPDTAQDGPQAFG